MAKHATEHRLALLLRPINCHLSAFITGTDPLKDGLALLNPQGITEEDRKSAEAVSLVEATIAHILEHHPLTVDRKKAGLS